MKKPAFQFYPGDYLASARVAMMTLEEEGAYIRLLCYCWSHGSIPADPEKAARLIGKGGSTTLATVVQAMFTPKPGDPSLLIHDRLEEERAKQAKWAEKSRIGGKLSAEARKTPKSGNGGSTTLQPPFNHPTNQTPTKGQLFSLQSSSSSSMVNTPPLPPAGGNEGADEGKPKIERKRDPLFDALAASTEGPPEQVTKSTARLIGVALADIRRVCPDLTPAEIQRRAANYRTHFREAALTASALAKHWARCDSAPQTATNATQWQPDRNADPDAW